MNFSHTLTDYYPVVLIPSKVVREMDTEIKLEKFMEVQGIEPLTEKELIKIYEFTPRKRETRRTESVKLDFGCGVIFFTIIVIVMCLLGLIYAEDADDIQAVISSSVGLLFLAYIFFSLFTEEIKLKEYVKSYVVTLSDKEHAELIEEYNEKRKEAEILNEEIKHENLEKRRTWEKELKANYKKYLIDRYQNSLTTTATPVKNFENKKRGKSELLFLRYLIDAFGNRIKVDETPSTDENFNYFPDFVYVCDKTKFCIDIEIDEPYSFKDKSPIHYVDVDYNRNAYFLGLNWGVIRFTEQQIIEEPQSCIALIQSVVDAISCKNNNFQSSVTPQKRWTYEEALLMANDNVRNKWNL